MLKTRYSYSFLHAAMGLGLLCIMLLGSAYPAAAGGICYVKWDAAPPGTGSSWDEAYPDLQSALANIACTEIWVTVGTYRPTGGADRTISFALKNGVSLLGGFAGTETLPNERNPAVNVTILSGDLGAPGDPADNSYHVVIGSDTDVTAVLDGFTITGGNANGGWPNYFGGGMYNSLGSPTLRQVIFAGNMSLLGGGGMYNSESNPHLTDVVFQDNQATGPAGGGGGIYNTFMSAPVLTNVTFSANSAKFGGAIYNGVISNPMLTNVTFSGNIAASKGGAIYDSESSPSLLHVTFNGNQAPSAGGIYNYSDSLPVITNSILYGDPGGEIFDEPPSASTVSYSLVHGGFPGIGNLDADPLLGPLQNNGGFTQTRAPAFNSPGIDKGLGAGCPSTDQRGLARPQGPACDMGAVEYPLSTLTLTSSGAQDGWILESAENSTLGGTMNAAATTFNLGDDAAKKQYRSILSFNTAGLPDEAVIKSARLLFMKAGVAGANPFATHGNILVDVRKGYFGTAALQLTDFQATPSKPGALAIKNTTLKWFSGTLAPANLTSINKAGWTQFRLRFTKDDDNDAVADYLKIYSGNAGATSRPKLVITYYAP